MTPCSAQNRAISSSVRMWFLIRTVKIRRSGGGFRRACNASILRVSRSIWLRLMAFVERPRHCGRKCRATMAACSRQFIKTILPFHGDRLEHIPHAPQCECGAFNHHCVSSASERKRAETLRTIIPRLEAQSRRCVKFWKRSESGFPALCKPQAIKAIDPALANLLSLQRTDQRLRQDYHA